jgi:hypothetical protein
MREMRIEEIAKLLDSEVGEVSEKIVELRSRLDAYL